jgi:cytochrome c peroxidase
MAGHPGHGHELPAQARALKNPVHSSPENLAAGERLYQRECASCHALDGKANTLLAFSLPHRPANLLDHLMDSMRDGELWWVETYGVAPAMPAMANNLNATERWQVVEWVREMRLRQKTLERAKVPGDYDWQLPPGFPYPNIPPDNAVTAAKVTLGRYLFHDNRLSGNQTQSCATCHQQRYAFADRRGRGIGSTGELHPRGPMSLANVAYLPVLTWANPNMRTLEKQMLVPLFGEHPLELGMSGQEQVLLERLRAEPRYPPMFAAAYPTDQNPITLANIVKAVTSFERTIISGRSPYDDYRSGQNPDAISAQAKRGESLFYSERTECFHCHGGFNFTGSVDYLDKGFAEVEFHNNGLYNIAGPISYPADNPGIFEFTQDPADVGRLKAPSLRNVAVTAPYMHDGSIGTLEGVVDHYSAGGRTLAHEPNARIGADNPNKSEFIKHIGFTAAEKAALIAFLKSLTDNALLTDDRFSDPWVTEEAKEKHILLGVVREVDRSNGSLVIKHGPVGTFMPGMTMEYQGVKPKELDGIAPGTKVQGDVIRKGDDYWIDHLRTVPAN